MQYSKSALKNLCLKLLLLVSSIIFVLFLTECFLRVYTPYFTFGAGKEQKWVRKSPRDLTKIITVDPDFGFRPILGNNIYNKYGTSINNYPENKSERTTRLLFIGDSVTFQGGIIHSLKEIYGEDNFEYWNAGVGGFNTIQEVKFYKKYNAFINPDHVILIFHPNDFETTPVVFINKRNKFVIYEPNRPLASPNRWLFAHSYVYRMLLGFNLNWEKGREAIGDEIIDSLKELKDILVRDNISFTVLVLPLLKPYEKWHPHEKELRNEILKMLEDLNIRYFDLYEPLQQAITEGITIKKSPADCWHPATDLSCVFAKYLFESSLL